MGYPRKGSSNLDIKNGTSITKTDGDKLKLFAEQLKSVFASKIDLRIRIYKEKPDIFLSLTFKTIHH